MNAAQIAQKAEGLGPWFQNLDLKGVRTAPSGVLRTGTGAATVNRPDVASRDV